MLEGIKSISNTCINNQIPLEIESDALLVINALVGDEEDLSELKLFVEAISSISSRLSSVTFNHYNRLANSVAH